MGRKNRLPETEAKELLNWNYPCMTVVLKDKILDQLLLLKPSRYSIYSNDFLIVFYYDLT